MQTLIQAVKTPRGAMLAILLWAVALTVGAYVLEYGWGVQPCELCWYQRYIHWAIVAWAGVALAWGLRPKVALVGAVALGVLGMGAAFYHVLVEHQVITHGCGVERFYQLTADPAALTALLAEAPVPACDEPYKLFFLSLPSWNVLAMALVAIMALGALYAQGLNRVVPVGYGRGAVATKPTGRRPPQPAAKPAVKRAGKRR